MRSYESDFDYFFFIMNMRDQPEGIVYDLKSGAVILYHFCFGKIGQDILLFFAFSFADTCDNYGNSISRSNK